MAPALVVSCVIALAKRQRFVDVVAFGSCQQILSAEVYFC